MLVASVYDIEKNRMSFFHIFFGGDTKQAEKFASE